MDNSEKSFLLSTDSLTPPRNRLWELCLSLSWKLLQERSGREGGCLAARMFTHFKEKTASAWNRFGILVGVLRNPRKRPSVRVSCGCFPLRGGHELFRKTASNVPSAFSSFEQHSSKDSLPGEVSSPCTLFGQLNKTKQNKAVVLEKKLQVP